MNGTVLEAVEGERVRIYATNRLPVPTSIHWHSFYLPNGMDGVAGLTRPYIRAGETAKYEWTLRQYGSLMFHSHHDEMTQMGMGLIGMFVVHPRNPSSDYRVDRDFSLMISEWSVKAGTARPNTLEMTDFDILTINGKVLPSTTPLVCKTGDRVRIRIGNLGAMDHHPRRRRPGRAAIIPGDDPERADDAGRRPSPLSRPAPRARRGEECMIGRTGEAPGGDGRSYRGCVSSRWQRRRRLAAAARRYG